MVNSTPVGSIKIYKHLDNNHDGSKMAGMLLKEGDNKYSIHIDGNETYCTQRLALCKELVQILVDGISENTNSPLDATRQIIEAAQELIQKFYSSNSKAELTDMFASTEMFAHSIALELMIPYTLREEISTAHYINGASLADIAKRLFITQETLEEYMKTYFLLTTPIYKIIK